MIRNDKEREITMQQIALFERALAEAKLLGATTVAERACRNAQHHVLAELLAEVRSYDDMPPMLADVSARLVEAAPGVELHHGASTSQNVLRVYDRDACGRTSFVYIYVNHGVPEVTVTGERPWTEDRPPGFMSSKLTDAASVVAATIDFLRLGGKP